MGEHRNNEPRALYEPRVLHDPIKSIFSGPDIKQPDIPDPGAVSAQEAKAEEEARRKQRQQRAGASGSRSTVLTGAGASSGTPRGATQSLLGSN